MMNGMKIVVRTLTLVLAASFSGWVFAQCNDAMLATSPAERFVSSSEETLVDTATGLMWARCSLGFDWQNNNCVRNQAVAEQYTWSAALQQAQVTTYGVFNGWRLPNKKELDSIVERRCFAPAVNEVLFPNSPASLYWSSTPNAFRFEVSWVVDFDSGAHRNLAKTELAAVRLVRDYTE